MEYTDNFSYLSRTHNRRLISLVIAIVVTALVIDTSLTRIYLYSSNNQFLSNARIVIFAILLGHSKNSETSKCCQRLYDYFCIWFGSDVYIKPSCSIGQPILSPFWTCNCLFHRALILSVATRR